MPFPTAEQSAELKKLENEAYGPNQRIAGKPDGFAMLWPNGNTNWPGPFETTQTLEDEVEKSVPSSRLKTER